MNNQEKFQNVKKRIIDIYNRTHPPKPEDYLELIKKTNEVLTTEKNETRPHDNSGLPGGIVYLKPDIPTIILSDIHARLDYVISILFSEDMLKYTMLEKIAHGLVQIVCVGDGVHAESRAAKRWTAAFEEYKTGYIRRENIDDEMRESFGVMEMIMELKIAFPENIHFLKGNHENITNEKGNGNHPFMKFATEGPMVDYYVKKFYGEETSKQYYDFEKNLPIFAIGKNFLISHAEPRKFFTYDSIVEYRNNPEVILGLTWTDDDASEDGSVEKMLNTYINADYLKDSFYFGGHRPVKELFNSRANGKFIQIHNPNKFVAAAISKDRKLDPKKDIVEIKKIVKLVDETYAIKPNATIFRQVKEETNAEEPKVENKTETDKVTEPKQMKEEAKTEEPKVENKTETDTSTEPEQKIEEVKTEEPKEENKTEPAKTTEPEQKKEEVKAEEPKEENKTEPAKTVEPKQKKEEVKTEKPKVENKSSNVNTAKTVQDKQEPKRDDSREGSASKKNQSSNRDQRTHKSNRR